MKKSTFLLTLIFGITFQVFAYGNTGMNLENNGYANVYESNLDYSYDMSVFMKEQPGKYGEDSAQCVRNLSIYVEYYRQRNLGMAAEPWRWVFLNCPAARQNTYIHGAQILKYLYSMENDPINREAIVDTLMTLYDKRIEHFGREGMVLGRKAADLYTFRPNNVIEIYEISEKSIQLEGNSSAADVLLINFHSLTSLVDAGLTEVEEIVFAFDRAMNILDHNIKSNGANANTYEITKGNIEAMFRPFASCDNIVSLFSERFNNNPNDKVLLEKIIDMLNSAGCTEDELYYKANRNLHKLEPTAQTAFLLGRMDFNNANYQKAIKFFEDALTLFEEEEEKYTTYMLLSEILFRQFNRYSDARNYALKAATARPGEGRPFIIIGEMYAASAKQCGDNEFTESVAYWAAVDKFNHAKRVDDDPSIQQRADLLIDTWSRHFPTNETIFFYGFSEGETYTDKCWINETTRIRAR